MIKPAFFKHAELYAAERDSGLPLRVAFAGLWTVTDRDGRFKWKHDLKPDVLPYDPVDMMAVLDALERGGFVTSYIVDGKRYGFIPSFKEHQTFHHTERKSTLPAPESNREPPVRHTADTVTVAVTELVVVDCAKDDESDLTALFLAIAANQAVTERWGEQTSPYTQGSAESLADALRTAGVPREIARVSIYQQCRESKHPKPPRSINYFRPGVEADWASEQMRRTVAASSEPPPSDLPRSTHRSNGSSAGAGRAAQAFGKIRALIQTTQQPGQAALRFIPKTEVEAIGPDVLNAYESVGGAERFLSTSGDKIGLLLRDFTLALGASA